MPVNGAPQRRRSVIAVAAVGVLATAAVGWLVSGPGAAAGVVLAATVVIAFLLSGRIPVLLEPQVPKGMAFMLLGMGYVLRILLLLVVLLVFGDADWLDKKWFGAVLIGGALVWNAVQLRTHLRRRPVPAEVTATKEKEAAT